MNWLVFHIASGQAFFSGVALVLVAAAASTQSRAIFKRLTVWAFLLGVLAIVLSSTPISCWCCASAAVAMLAWIASAYVPAWRRWTAAAVAAAWLAAALAELPYHIARSLAPVSSRSVTVIGDSVSAGVGGSEKSETWPKILAREHGLTVQDLSQMGETAASALKHVRSQVIRSPVIVVEIGGNDLLGSTTLAQFARDLDALLADLASDNRQILMFELPLPPFHNEYGRIQRATAEKYGVKLIPKRVFSSVVVNRDLRIDGIHLSQSGHQRMADRVWRMIQSAMPPERAE